MEQDAAVAGEVPRPAPLGASGGGGFDLIGWFSAPRREGGPGAFALGPEPRRTAGDGDVVDGEESGGKSNERGWRLLVRAALNLVAAWVVLLYGGSVLIYLIESVVPGGVGSGAVHTLVTLLGYLLVVALLVKVFGRMGRWLLVYRRYLRPLFTRLVTHEEPGAEEAAGRVPTQSASRGAAAGDPWGALRPTVPADAVALLDAQTAAGRVGDVDHTRLHRAWRAASVDGKRFAAFADTLRSEGAAAFAHPSGARDLAPRSAAHDLMHAQVRLGAAEDVPRNPSAYRGAELALDPALLGTSLLAVGPAASGKTARLVRPVAESLCLQALCGTAVVVVVGAADADLGPDSWYDVVIAPGDRARGRYGLDLFGASSAADEAAARLADALLPEELALRAETARSTLYAVLAAFRSGYRRNPGVRELCALLRGEPDEWSDLREVLDSAGELAAHRRELEHRERLHGRADDLGALLADRLALLDRAELAGCFNPSGNGEAPEDASAALPLFAVRALEHPLRVRVALPERSQPEAARILARLVVGQFLHAAAVRRDRSLFAGLVVDDASAAVDTHAVRGLQRIRGANAGAVLALRSLADLPETLRNPLFGAVGCRMAFPGLAPWDGRLFSDAWGTVWVQERDVTRTPDLSGGMLRRAFRAMRSLLEGERVQTESVTTRRVERERWSPSELAHGLPPGRAVLSLSTVEGETVPPMLVDLRPEG